MNPVAPESEFITFVFQRVNNEHVLDRTVYFASLFSTREVRLHGVASLYGHLLVDTNGLPFDDKAELNIPLD